MRKKVCLILIFLCVSCNYKNKRNSSAETNVAELPHSESKINTSNSDIWMFENEKIKQMVKTDYLDENTLQFRYEIVDKAQGMLYEIEGKAIHNAEFDIYGVELDEDKDGAYLVKEYIYDGTCWLAFRIDMEENRRMTINSNETCRHLGSLSTFYQIK